MSRRSARWDGRSPAEVSFNHLSLKSEPDLFLYAARRLGHPPLCCVVVEDSRYGVAGAKAAGMKAIGFAGGITPAAHLAAADVVITDMADLSSAVSLLLS